MPARKVKAKGAGFWDEVQAIYAPAKVEPVKVEPVKAVAIGADLRRRLYHQKGGVGGRRPPRKTLKHMKSY